MTLSDIADMDQQRTAIVPLLLPNGAEKRGRGAFIAQKAIATAMLQSTTLWSDKKTKMSSRAPVFNSLLALWMLWELLFDLHRKLAEDG